MKEEQLNTLREQDKNLRDAIRMEEAEMPQMPADLNARLMQRMSREPRKARTRTIWPWIAAACVAGVMMIWLTPPKEQMPTVAMQTPSQQTPSPTLPLNGKEEVSAEVSKVEEPVVAKVEKKEVPQRTPRAKKVQDTQKTLTPQAADVCNDLAAVQEQEESTPLPSGEGQKGEAVVTLTEHDIPITRPENYKYTPEELALMRKQANEAYLKWVQLELEISKYNLEQTAQK
jgi:hypothetical protein